MPLVAHGLQAPPPPNSRVEDAAGPEIPDMLFGGIDRQRVFECFKRATYVAHPLFHDNQYVMHLRMEAARHATVYLTHIEGKLALPTTVLLDALFSHMQDHVEGQPYARTFSPQREVLLYDFSWIKLLGHMTVLEIPGWTESNGVAAEIQYAASCDIPITYRSPYELGVPQAILENLESPPVGNQVVAGPMAQRPIQHAEPAGELSPQMQADRSEVQNRAGIAMHEQAHGPTGHPADQRPQSSVG